MTQAVLHRISGSKPKLVYFQFKYDARLPRFLLIHKEEHVRCLQQHFEVVVVAEDCDYDAVCTLHAPELALFESGVPNPLCRRLNIANTRSHAHIPKVGLLHADAFCQGREGFISDMCEWGIDIFFTIATAALDFNRELEGRLLFWPNSIDPAVYHDYGEKKSIDVLFTGNTSALYPWRQKLLAIVPKKYSSTIKAHPGYSPSAQAAKIAVGEAYARMINSAFFVPSCGTVAREIVRKHFEIPACNSCLVTERTAAIEAAGYRDMVNCVFADEHDVIEKLQWLFGNPEKLAEITLAGHALVHARHTMKQRDQIHQWFTLSRGLSSRQCIVQPDAFAPLQVVDRALATFPAPTLRPQLDLLAQGDERFQHSDFAAARQFYQRCVNFVDYMPEPHLRIALCELQLGRAARAYSWITRPLEFSLGKYRASDPDPVEWATYVLCLLCQGRHHDAFRCAHMFANVDHLALRRIRWLVNFIMKGADSSATIPVGTRDDDRLTIHRLPPLAPQQWVAQMVGALAANNRDKWAQALSAFGARIDDPVPAGVERATAGSMSPGADPMPAKVLAAMQNGQRAARTVIQRHFARRARRREAMNAAIAAIRHGLYGLEARLGYFLPFQYSSIRHAEFFLQLQDAFNDSAVSSAIVIAPGRKDRYAQGFLQAAAASTKAAVLRSFPNWNAGGDTHHVFDLALVDCSTAVRKEELARAIATFAGTSRYLFFVNCQRSSLDRLGALLAGRFERTAVTSMGGSRDQQHLAFRRIRVDNGQPTSRLSTAGPLR